MRYWYLWATVGLGGSVVAFGCESDSEKPPMQCPSRECNWVNPEDGGEIRADNMIYPDGSSHTLVTAHFFDSQTGKMDFPIVNTDLDRPMECNWVGGSGGEGSIANPDPDEIYPFGDASDEVGVTATFAPGGRNYMDVGETVSLQAEGRAAIELQRYEDHLTPFAGGSFHSIAYGPAPSSDAATAIPAELMGGVGDIAGGQRLDVTLSGGADAARTNWFFKDQGHGIELPPRPVILASNGNAIDWSQAGAPLASQELLRGEDLHIRYEVPDSVDPDLLTSVTIYQTEPVFEVTHICLNTHPGTATLPGSLHEQMPPRGMMVVSNFYHRLRYLVPDRRVDLVGLASTSSYYTLVDPVPEPAVR